MTTKTVISALPEEPAVREVIPGVTTAEEVRALLNYLGDERNRFVTAEQLALIGDIPDKLDSSAVRWFGGTNLARGTSDQWMTVADGDYLAKKVKIGAWEDGVTVSVSFQINACSTPNWVIDVIDEYDYTEAVLTNSSSDDTLFYADFSLDRNEESYRFDFRVRSLSADDPVEMDIRNLILRGAVCDRFIAVSASELADLDALLQQQKYNLHVRYSNGETLTVPLPSAGRYCGITLKICNDSSAALRLKAVSPLCLIGLDKLIRDGFEEGFGCLHSSEGEIPAWKALAVPPRSYTELQAVGSASVTGWVIKYTYAIPES